MKVSPESENYLSQGTDEEPFPLERYRPRLAPTNPPPDPSAHLNEHPLTQPPKTNMPVDGAGLRALSDITVKAEIARDEILDEIASSTFSKLKKCLRSGENRPFIDALYELEHVIATTAEEVRADQLLFKSIEPARTKAAYKQLCKAMRGLAQALSRMTAQHGTEKYIRVCRKYVVRVLRIIVFHYGVRFSSKASDAWRFANSAAEADLRHGTRSKAGMGRAYQVRRRRERRIFVEGTYSRLD